jgi:hypothetical protein
VGVELSGCPTIDGKAIKIASMLDGHIREALLHLV